MKISIAMASYNGEQFIKEQLDSFLSQTRLPDELIITDDCSSDRTEELVKQFADSAPFDVIFSRNEKNLGYAGNFNSALMKTTGDLVFLSDQDDVWFPEKIDKISALAENEPHVMAFMNNAELTDADLSPLGTTKLGQLYSAGFGSDSFVMGCCMAVKRDLLDLSMPIHSKFNSHDGWLSWFADGLEGKLIIDEVLQYYRRHNSNASWFVANSTKKINKIDFYYSTAVRLFKSDSAKRDAYQIEQYECFVEGLIGAKSKAGAGVKSRLDLLILRSLETLNIMKARAEIRKRSFGGRFIGVLMLILAGEYRKLNGFKSIAKDLIG